MHLVQFIRPAFQLIRCVPAPLLREFKEARSRLHVANLMHDYYCQHASPRRVFFGRNLAKHNPAEAKWRWQGKEQLSEESGFAQIVDIDGIQKR